ncbi:dTDP-4-amino-4,6-dideoxygalactose transaminase [Vibrio aestuarianus]|uniref:dTDP-4-amino-4,6-dideoxygalactose transaminase n=1 Tax=Vibrio aestuarianus TaxID=28171 RepID=UPI00237CC14E|nr:dTDP-4-amino-4,6-dideoxygalactose transaminase [Vibrio aestuarianus]MDE1335106.1 dTDP-4-amino-4,6-dideoxygalactose transaminase [Vibrio aestuarianus]
MIKVPFNKPCVTGNELSYIKEAINHGNLCGDGPYTKKCEHWFTKQFGVEKALLTSSCTHALEMSAILLDINADDEVIVPSYTFVSSANAFAIHGAKIVFVDVDPRTMNLDLDSVARAINARTKAIVAVHYAGVCCDMDELMRIAEREGVYVIEDAAQAVMSTYKGKYLGTIGHLGTYSFHETKNYTSGGEGGLLLINDSNFEKRAEIIREKGTNRSELYKGLVDKYTWVDIGSSYVLSDMSAAYLLAQLESAKEINNKRLLIWNKYFNGLKHLEENKKLRLPNIPSEVTHNAHMFYLILESSAVRDEFIEYMRRLEISTPFHYIPLHSSPAGSKLGNFYGEDEYTTNLASRLVRLPLYHSLGDKEIDYVISSVERFFCV